MDHLQELFSDIKRGARTEKNPSCFEHLTTEELESHLQISRYNDFVLSDAIRPAYNRLVVPTEGYRHDSYEDPETGQAIPVLMISASKEKVFELFQDLLEPLGTTVDLVLEASHSNDSTEQGGLYREHIDMPVLKSILWGFEEQLVNDGCCGVAVLNPSSQMEVQFDEHKLLMVYAHDPAPFEEILAQYGIKCNEEIKFLTEAEHVHSSTEDFAKSFEQIKMEFALDGEYC